MNGGATTIATHEPWPRWWRLVLVAICTLILCSCQAVRRPAGPPGCPAVTYHPALPRQAFTGGPEGYLGSTGPMMASPEGVEDGAAVPTPPWTPPGLSTQPWPPDEYLCDGGDAVPTAAVRRDWEIRGLNVEDTIAHFDTLDGRRLVVPSNQVSIYSPRFGAVRQVVGLKQSEQRSPWADVHQPLTLVRHDNLQIAASSQQHVQSEAEIGHKLPSIHLTERWDTAASAAHGLLGYDNRSLPLEAPSAVRQGMFEEAEMAWLAHGVNAAIAWSGGQPVQVFIDRTKAVEEVSDQWPQSIFTVRSETGHPRLRVIKAASTQFAQPGETVDFTLRFDNVGDQVIGNVTIIDSLTTRLEYVPDSAQCSLTANFLTEPNEGESLALRWEITDPLQPGEGGVIHFRCRVR